MPCEIVVIFGNISVENLELDSLVAQFGCSFRKVTSFDELRDLCIHEPVAVVLIDRNTLKISWNEALGVLRKAASTALPIVCHRFSERIDWPVLAEAGAYHALLLPLNSGEVRQSLGFALAAKKRHPENVVPLRSAERKTSPLDFSHRVCMAGGSTV